MAVQTASDETTHNIHSVSEHTKVLFTALPRLLLSKLLSKAHSSSHFDIVLVGDSLLLTLLSPLATKIVARKHKEMAMMDFNLVSNQRSPSPTGRRCQIHWRQRIVLQFGRPRNNRIER